MFKKLIILSLTFLLISCGEEETPTKEETTATANTQTATTNSDTIEEIANIIPEEAQPDTSQTESAVIDEDITEALFGNSDMFEEVDLPEEPTSVTEPKTESTPPKVTTPQPKTPIVAQQEKPNTEEGEVRGYNQEELAKMRQEKMRQEKMRRIRTEENSFLIYNGTSEYISVESKSTILGVALSEEKARTSIHSGHCLRVNNRHLGNITIRRDSLLEYIIFIRALTTICRKSDCPQGGIFVGYVKDDDGNNVPAVRSLRDEDSRTVAKCFPLQQYQYLH